MVITEVRIKLVAEKVKNGEGTIGKRRHLQSEHGFPINNPSQWRLDRAIGW